MCLKVYIVASHAFVITIMCFRRFENVCLKVYGFGVYGIVTSIMCFRRFTILCLKVYVVALHGFAKIIMYSDGLRLCVWMFLLMQVMGLQITQHASEGLLFGR